jgi:alpha-3'-ketoglucosidase
MSKLFSFLLAGTFVFALSCQSGQKKAAQEPEVKSAAVEETAGPNQLTQAEKDAGWVLLFDGQTANGWRGYNKTDFPKGWEIVDGTLHCKGSGNGEAGGPDGGDIIYDKKFKNFDMKVEWKISKGGNSGIFYLAQEIPGKEVWRTAPEMQILDNANHIDATLGKDGNRQAGSLYDLLPAKPQNSKPFDEWNSAEIISYQGTIVHKQNGETVLEYHLWTPEWNALVAGSKFPEYNKDWANVAKEGYIAFQDHGGDVWFRNIKIKVLE